MLVRNASMGSFWQEISYAIRLLRKSPSFTWAAIITLAVAIGANAVAFGALDGLIVHPLNVPRPESLYLLERARDKNGPESYPNYLDLRTRNHSFEDLAACNFDQAGLDTGQEASRVWLCQASGNYFDALGIQPYLGRFFHASDERGPNSAPYMVLTYAYWRSRFHADRGVVGRTVQLNKHPFTIIGIAPPGFNGILLGFALDLFVPIVNQGQIDGENLLKDRRDRWVDWVFGHLKAGITPAQAIADLNSIGAALGKSYPKDDDQMTFVLGRPSLGGDTLGLAVRAFVGGLMLLVALILLAGCANLGTLFAARASDRTREIALRIALGSSSAGILRTLFTEAVLVSLAGGALGLWGSVSVLHGLSEWQPFPQFPMRLPVDADAHVYEVALLLSFVSALLFAAVPVRQVLRTDPYPLVNSRSAASVGRRITFRTCWLRYRSRSVQC